MEIFSPGPVPYPGTYQCPRCNSREVYDSEKTIGVSAMTIDVPGPVNSTIVNVDKVSAKRCRYCNTVTPYLRHPKAQAEFEARKRKKIEKNLKKAGIVIAVIASLFILINLVNGISNKISENRVANTIANGNAKLSEVRAEWQNVADTCGLNETVELVKVPDKYESPQVSLYFQIKPASEYASFWKSAKGSSLDCFSSKIYGAKLSEKLLLSPAQLEDPAKNISLFEFEFYDGVEKDGSIYAQGVIGHQDQHLGGYLTYFEDYDLFAISLSWELDKNWTRD